jgi:hypothetical protein
LIESPLPFLMIGGTADAMIDVLPGERSEVGYAGAGARKAAS